MGVYTTSSDSGVDRFWGEMARLQDEINDGACYFVGTHLVHTDSCTCDEEYMEYQQERADEARQSMREDGINV